MGLVLYGVIILDLIGFLLCIYLVFRHKRKAKAIKHYEDVRDKLTFREAEKEVTSEAVRETCGTHILGNLIGGFIVLLVGMSLIGTVGDQLEEATEEVTNPLSEEILNMMPFVYALGILIASITLVFQGLRAGGLIGI